MLDKIFILLSCCILFITSSREQSVGSDSIWKKLTFINDTLKSSSEVHLQSLLKIESTRKRTSFKGDSTDAFLLSGIGRLYYEKGDFLKGAQYYRQSIDLITSNFDKPWMKPDLLVMCYYRLNTIYDSLNRVSDELKALDSCISISGRLVPYNKFCLAALYKKVEYFIDVGDYNNSIHYATICEMLAKQFATSGGKNEYDYGTKYAYSSLLWNVNAQIVLKNYEVAEKLLNAKLDESLRTGNSFNLGTIYNHLAEVQKVKKNFDKALFYYNKAFLVEKKEGHDISCKAILTNIGYVFYLRKDDYSTELALRYYRRALAIVSKDKLQSALNSVETLDILGNIGRAYAQKGLYDSAFIYYQLALNEIKPGMNETELLKSPMDEFDRQKKISYITDLLLEKGDTYLQLYKAKGDTNALKLAVQTYKVTDQLLDRIKTEQSDALSKLFWRGDSRRLYENAIEACFSYDNSEDAFYFFEKSRAVLLTDQINQQRWLDEEDIQNLAQIKRKIFQLTNATSGIDKDSIRFKDLQNKLFSARQELNHLTEVIKGRNPLYYQSFLDLKVATVEDVKKYILLDHQGLVEIFSGDSAVYVLILQSNQSNLIKLNKIRYDSLSATFLKYLSNTSLINNHYKEFNEVSIQLYQLIFGNKKLPRGRIVISPDGQYFPFEALLTNSPEETPDYFLKDYAVSYTYSARFMMSQFVTHSVSPSHVFLGIAPVKYTDNLHLANLTGSDLSLMQLRPYFRNANNLTLSMATKSGFMNNYSKYKIIQLYTHASDSGRNGEPVIYFADSALYLSELLGEDKPATSLVVLSACESGIGKLFKGEGVFSFNRGFAALGIPASISNLWSVEDQSTYQLTELFYKYLSEEMPTDVALQKAKIEFISTASKKNQLPYYWASSILIGKNGTIEMSQSGFWSIFIGIVAALICVTLLILPDIKIAEKNNFLK